MLTDKRRHNIQVALTSMIAVLTIIIGPGAVLEVPAAICLALFLPGYAVLRAAKKNVCGVLEIGSLSVGLSMAIAALGGLLLNLAGALSATGWALLLGGVVILASVVSFQRSSTPMPIAPPENATAPLMPRHFIMYAAAAICMVTSFGMARSGALNHQEYAFTEFWMVPKGAANNIVTIGIRNAEKVTSTYQVALFADGAATGRLPEITLTSGESWTGDFSLNAQFVRAGRAQAWLFKSSAPQDVYRKVWLARPASVAITEEDQR